MAGISIGVVGGFRVCYRLSGVGVVEVRGMVGVGVGSSGRDGIGASALESRNGLIVNVA